MHYYFVEEVFFQKYLIGVSISIDANGKKAGSATRIYVDSTFFIRYQLGHKLESYLKHID